jgi:hypothetical protein
VGSKEILSPKRQRQFEESSLGKQKWDITSMTWEEKETVLRLLFSKMNNPNPPRTSSALSSSSM